MSNVRIEATGEVGLSVEVHLGPNLRAVHPCASGDAIELTVGGNQVLKVFEVAEGGSAEAEQVELPIGADILAEGGEQNPVANDTPAEGESPLNPGVLPANPFDPEQ